MTDFPSRAAVNARVDARLAEEGIATPEDPSNERMNGIIEALDRGENLHPTEGSWLVDHLVLQHTRWLGMRFCYSEPNQLAFYGPHDANPCALCARRISQRVTL